jgi:DNA-binding transcriptional LysR family regulator
LIDKLEYLIALAREQHFGRAAEACGVTQPTLSAGLKQLEDRFGTQLVYRASRFQGLTPEGERVLVWARRIVADTRAMHQDISALKHGLSGHLRIAVIPTALPMVHLLTTPFRDRHPAVRFSILSCNSAEIVGLIEGLEVDAGLTYLDREPLGRLRSVPLYQEQYRLLTMRDSPLGDRDSVGWAELGRVPLCLLTPDMQNRRILDELLANAGTVATPNLESNSILALVSHVRTGRWASIVSENLATMLGLGEPIRAIPITHPAATSLVGLVALAREPMTPLLAALVAEAHTLARHR